MLAVARMAAATTAEVHVPPTLVSHGRTQVTVLVTDPPHAASAAHKHHAPHVMNNSGNRATKCSAKTQEARALTWASSVMISTSANPAAMCQQAFLRQVYPHGAAAVVVAGAAIAAVAVVVATLVAEAHAQVVAVVGVIRAVGFGADHPARQTSVKKAASGCFLLFLAAF